MRERLLSKYFVVHVPFAKCLGQLPKDVPFFVREIKHVKGIYYVDHCPSVTTLKQKKLRMGDDCKYFDKSDKPWIQVQGSTLP